MPLDRIAVREAFESPAAVENRFILKKMGPLAGLRLLDVGAGLGESAVYFALRGAKVTATDLSPGMVRCAVDLGKLHGVEVEGVVSAGEALGVPEGTFDLVYVANTIHHVTDKRALFEQVHRALKPGGRFFSFDPLAYNPVINVYRKMATQVRTEDEAPLTFADVKLAGEFFEDVGHREFWIAAMALFLKYYLIDRVHPNADRYWKRIFKETPARLWWWWPLRGGRRDDPPAAGPQAVVEHGDVGTQAGVTGRFRTGGADRATSDGFEPHHALEFSPVVAPCTRRQVRGMEHLREGPWLQTPSRRDYVNITPQVEDLVRRSGIAHGLYLVNAMHITACVYVNDAGDDLFRDYIDRLERIVSNAPASQ